MTDDPKTFVDIDHLFAEDPATDHDALPAADVAAAPSDDSVSTTSDAGTTSAGPRDEGARSADVAQEGEGRVSEGHEDGRGAGEEPIDWEARADDDGRTRAELLEALATAEVERNDWLDQLRRKQAEFDNFRKRMARDAQRQRVVGQEAVARSLLDALDDFDRTLAALETDEAARKGVELVRDKLVLALQGQGMVAMDAAGTPFDPNLHEAVQQVPGDGDTPTVADVLRTGWMMHDRVLRPAMVVVAQ